MLPPSSTVGGRARRIYNLVLVKQVNSRSCTSPSTLCTVRGTVRLLPASRPKEEQHDFHLVFWNDPRILVCDPPWTLMNQPATPDFAGIKSRDRFPDLDVSEPRLSNGRDVQRSRHLTHPFFLCQLVRYVVGNVRGAVRSFNTGRFLTHIDTMRTMSTRLSGASLSVQMIPPALRPVCRAFVVGYASSTAPRLLTLLLTHLGRKRKNIDEKPDDYFLLSFLRILKGGLELQRFPTFCAALVGGSTLLQARDRTALPEFLVN